MLRNFIISLVLLLTTQIAYASNCERPKWNRHNISGYACKFDTRHYILYKNGQDLIVNRKCKVKNGTWQSYYTQTSIIGDPLGKIEIDHLFPWAEMKRRGVCDRSKKERIAIYNDITNLVIATHNENQIKKDKLYLPFKVSQEKQTEYKQKLLAFCEKWKFDRCNDFK